MKNVILKGIGIVAVGVIGGAIANKLGDVVFDKVIIPRFFPDVIINDFDDEDEDYDFDEEVVE